MAGANDTRTLNEEPGCLYMLLARLSVSEPVFLPRPPLSALT